MAFDPNSTNNVTVRRFYSVMSSLWAKIKAAIPLASSTTPSMDGTADAGSETTWARGDHVHPTDTSRAPTSHASSGTTYGIGTTSNYGHVKLATGDMNGADNVDGFAVSKNHTHSQYVPTTRKVNGQALSADVTIATPGTLKTNATTAQSASSGEAMSGTITLHKVSKTGTYSDLIGKPTIPGGSSTTPLMDGTAAVGTETSWAHGDHVHPTDTSREAAANKKTSINVSSNTDFPTSKAVADFVNSSIATATAEFLGTYDVVADLGLTTSATNAQIATALGTHTWPSGVTPTNQDYVFVSVDDPGTTTDSAEYRRFKYNGTAWVYEYTLNNSSFTQAQWDAINSGVTATFVQNAVTGVKGGNESTYRTGQVNITKANIGLGNVANTNITVSATAGVKDVTNNVTYKYTHPTFTAVSAAAKKVGMNSEGHVVLGDALTKGDVGLGNVVNTGDSATPAEGGTDKFTTGGAFTELAKKGNKENSVYYVAGTTYTAYSTSRTYTATTSTGPFDVTNSCLYNNYPYYCTTTISTPESWTSGHWSQIPTAIWGGTNSEVTELYVGLKIAYKVPSYGGKSATQINLNGLGAKTVLRNSGNITTHLGINSIAFLVFDGTYWRWADNDSNTWVTTMGAYCDTAAGTAAKSASSANTVYTPGIAFITRFVYTNSAANKLTLNLNNQGAKDLWINGAVSSSTNYTIPAGEHWTYYDGTKFCIWTDGTAQFKGLHLDTPLADTEIASASTWNAKEDASNKVSAWSETTTDVHYPSETLVKTDLDNRIDRYDAVYNRNNIAGDGWVKLADVTFSNTKQVDKPFVWDVMISKCTGATSTEQLTLNVRYNLSGLPDVYFRRYYTVDRTSTHQFAVVTYEPGGLASGANGKVELWAYLEKHWGSIGIREIAGSQSTALYGQNKVIANYYSYTSEGGTTKPVADLENNIQVIDSTNIQLASSSDVSTAITNAINALDVASVGGDGKYIKSISETNGKISATVETMDTTPTASSTKAVTSGGVKTALDSKVSSIKKNDTTINPSNGVADIGYIPTAYPVDTGTVQEVIQLLRVRPGGSIGSVLLKASTISSTTIAAGWYNYMWIPHRTGAANADLQNYGSLFLTPLTSTPNLYIVEGQSLNAESPTYRIRQFANATHTHGNVQNDGTLQTDDVTIASGDKLVITDNSDSDKVARASIAFDGTSTNKVLTQKGTFEDISGIDFDRYYLEPTSKDDYKSNLRYLQHIDVKTDAYLSCIKLYDITEFYDGTINNSGSDHSFFDGTIIKTRTEGSIASYLAHVTAHVGYNGASILTSDNASLRPVIIKENFEYVEPLTGFAWTFELDVAPTAETSTDVLTYGLALSAGDTYYINVSAPSGRKAWGVVNSQTFKCTQVASSNRYAGTFVATEDCLLICQTATSTTGLINKHACGILTDTPKYYLGILHTNSVLGGWFSFTGRWVTRQTDSTGSTVIHARPLLLEPINNIGAQNANLPDGYEIYTDTTYNTRAGSALQLTTARQLAVSLSNTTTNTTFNGSADVTNIKTTGTLGIPNGGTGKTSAPAAEYALLSKMGTDLSANEILENYRFVFATPTPSESSGRLAGFRTATAVWNWAKGKIKADSHCLDSDDAIDIWNSI